MRALLGTLVGSASWGMAVHTPSARYCQPWYGQTIRSPCVQPSESAVPRWMHRSLTACSRPSSPRQTTTGSPRSFVPNGVSPSSDANATGCQQLRSACMSGTADGGFATISVMPLPRICDGAEYRSGVLDQPHSERHGLAAACREEYLISQRRSGE